MSERKCYKCGTDKELSKRGKTVMICKPCRRAQYHNYIYRTNINNQGTTRLTVPKIALPEGWTDKAKASYKKILELRA